HKPVCFGGIWPRPRSRRLWSVSCCSRVSPWSDRMKASIVYLWCASLFLTVPAAAAAAGGGFPLAVAARQQDRAAVRALLKQRADVNAAESGGATALHWAAHWDD